ncbi:MAG TPA: hypothetical protein VF468_00795 [Actinomycetota bacterium]|nr:hypothetical protein [Actinomycetota bacterium]
MLVALLGATLLLLGPPASAATWTRVASPNLTQFDNVLFGVDATSSSNAWAVGRADDVSSPFRRPLIQRWNGTSWTIVSSPRPAVDSELRDVDASSASNAWAVGFTSGASSAALLQRWNGTSWRTVPGPSGSGILLGVKTLSASDAWVVGSRSTVGSFDSMAARWNGTSWTPVATPIPDSQLGSQLNAIDGTSSSNLWAVGQAGGGDYQVSQPIILRWNGSAWSAVATPAAIDATLEGVVALASNDVWAVGREFNRDLLWHVPWVLHWNGQSWRKVAAPAVLGAGLSAVTALSPTKVYAVGGGSLVLRWNGSSWTRESIPSSAGSLWDAAALGPSTVWAAGQRTRTNGASGTSILRTTNG